ncbi:MAG: hypothetical protein FD127_1621 [Acidimicrobiaceae bacterium]|nr:MAG: hypothetical protein FD127_1621 [Acidimicrobiaceae bacterium]
MSGEGGSGEGGVPDHLIASALEFAVGIAAAGARLRPALAFPAELRPFLKFTKLPAKALSEVRSAVEADTGFRNRLAAVAVPELVDEAGLIWLRRADGWHDRLLAAVPAGAAATTTDLRRSERRREAAERAARRAVVELAAARAELDRRGIEDAGRLDEIDQLRRERDSLRDQARVHQAEHRRALSRISAGSEQLAQRTIELQVAQRELVAAMKLRDEVLADRARNPAVDEPVASDGAALHRSDPAASAPARRNRGRRSSRQPIGLPGGLYGSSAAAAEFLVRRPGVMVLVDGYNVAKLAWPQLELDAQRDRCIDACEDVARRFGPEITVVFDGAAVLGTSAPRRLVRVSFSPAGVSADDVLRAEVLALSHSTPVVVVTNDQAVLTDVRASGANVLASEQWLALAGR